MNKILKITALVVTYNRLALLKECIEALRAQTYALERILIIDNHSNDGTAEYLATLKNDELFRIIRTNKNLGGAGGFSYGMKCACEDNPDYIWIMDDDTIPQANALEELLKYSHIPNVGFISSNAIWNDGSRHIMNIQDELSDQSAKEVLFADNESLAASATMLKSASFVSLLIPGFIPYEVGLPCAEFFIWCDDVEFVLRINAKGYHGILAWNSVVLHKTPNNYCSSLELIPAESAWKLFYGERNESYLRRKKRNIFSFFFSQLNKFRLHKRRIQKRKLPKEQERLLIKESRRGLLAGFFFTPKIEYIKRK